MKKITKILITGLLVLAACSSCGHDEFPEESSTSTSVVTSVCTTTTITSTTSTTTEVTTETVLTSPVTTVTETVSEEVPTETEVSSEVISEPVTEEYTSPVEVSYLPVREYERILLCNLVAREYGSDYVPIAEKAKVVAVVMNRVNSPNFPNTIYEVLTQPYQFSGYLVSDCYTSAVTDSVIESVDYYFNHTSEFSSLMLYFEGDGIWNYFS